MVLLLVSAAAFGTSGAFAKSLLLSGWTAGAAVSVRITIAAVLLAVPAFRALGGRWHLVRESAGTLVAFGLLAVAGCQLFYFNAVETLSVGVALLLEYLGLVFVVGWLWLREGQRPRRWTLVGVALAVAGLVLVLDVFGGAEVSVAGVLWGLGAAVGLATYFVLSARQEGDLPPLVLAAGGMVVGAVVLWVAGGLGAMPMRFATSEVVLAGADLPWFVPLAGVGVVAGAFAYAVGIAGNRRLGSKVAAFLGLTEVLFAIAFGWVLLDELPRPVQLVGGLLIVGGVAAVRYEELIADGDGGPPAIPTELAPDAPLGPSAPVD